MTIILFFIQDSQTVTKESKKCQNNRRDVPKFGKKQDLSIQQRKRSDEKGDEDNNVIIMQ